MKRGLPLSILCHSAILGWALLQIHRTPPLRPLEPDPVAVDIITDEALTKLMKGDRNAKNTEADAKESPEPPKKEQPKIAKATPPPPPPPPPAAEPVKEEVKPEPRKDEIAEKLAALPPDPAPGPSPEELKKQEEAKKAAEQKKKLDEQKKKQETEKKKLEQARKLAEQKKKLEENKKLNEKKYLEAMAKAIGAGDEPPPPLLSKAPAASERQTTAVATANKPKGPVKGAADGSSDKNLGNVIGSIITQRIEEQGCWNVAGGAAGADKQPILVHIRFKPNGEVEGNPVIVEGQANEVAARNAIFAVLKCSPYPLPPDKYALWKEVLLPFDPARMFR